MSFQEEKPYRGANVEHVEHIEHMGNNHPPHSEMGYDDHSNAGNTVIGPGGNVHEKVIGPGSHGAGTYVLVTPEMMESLRLGQAAHTHGLDGNNGVNGINDPPSPVLASHDGKMSVSHHEHPHPNGNAVVSQTSLVETAPTYMVNPLARFRHSYREYLGEFIGTMILIIFGNGVNCQVVLSNLTQGSYLSISFGWGIGVMFGVYACGGISGGHINPAVTIALATFRGFPWKKVPGYALAQILGALTGSALIQGHYNGLIDEFEGGTNVRTYGLETSSAALFFTDTKPYMTNVGAFFSEFMATAVLFGLILSIGDQGNNPVPPGMNGFALLWLIVGIGAALGTETAYCLNPARDLGPRIACAMYGFPKRIWTYRNCYWIYTPIIAPILGALFGAFIYDLFIYSGADGPLNKPWGRKRKAIAAPDAVAHHA